MYYCYKKHFPAKKNLKKLAKSLSVKRKCVILQPKPSKLKKNEESIQRMVVALLKI